MKRRTIAVIAALSGCALAMGASQSSAMSGKPRAVPAVTRTGPPVSCIPLQSISESHVRDGRTIDFLSSGRKGWRNVLPLSCPGLVAEGAFRHETSLSQLCDVDTIQVLDTIGGRLERGASCGLGKFQPIELAKRR